MARMRIFIVLVLAIAAGGVFAFGTYNYVQSFRPGRCDSDQAGRGRRGRPRGRRRDHQGQRPPHRVAGQRRARQRDSDPNEVIGRGLVMPMIQNEPFLDMKLAPKEAGAGLPPAIPPGLRAVSVKVNEVIGVAGYVLPGTHVDVVATVSPTQQSTDMTSKVILTNVQVLAAGTKIEQRHERQQADPGQRRHAARRTRRRPSG